MRLSGLKAIEIADRLFKGKLLSKQKSHTLHFGRIEVKGETLDEVLISLFRSPNSYTGQDSIEISCHGSDYILHKLLEAVVSEGARLAGPGEFTQRAYLNGKMDLSQAEAVADLIASENAASHRVALQQMRGGYSAEIKAMRQELIDFAALIELELDFGEEDVEFANREKLLGLIENLRHKIQELLKSFQFGNALKKGIPVAIVGMPNSGKSTLLNALLNEERAIVSDIPGTTRDTIEDTVVIKNLPFRFIDTAGLRETTNEIETIGISRALEKAKQAQVVIYLYDLSQENFDTAIEQMKSMADGITEDQVLLFVANKSDLAKNPDDIPAEHIALSAKEGLGIDGFYETLVNSVKQKGMDQNSLVITNARHFEALKNSDDSLAAASKGISEKAFGELVAADIRQTIHQLGTITGEISTDDLLGSIFGNFCIGK